MHSYLSIHIKEPNNKKMAQGLCEWKASVKLRGERKESTRYYVPCLVFLSSLLSTVTVGLQTEKKERDLRV